MFKIKSFIGIIAFVLLVAAVSSLSVLTAKQSKQIKFQQEQLTALQKNLSKALGQTAISFSISPTIKNSVTSAFGSTKNVTLQYYFTLDGKAMIVKPDSIYHVLKEY